jgi:hypothetical protein
LEDIKADSLQDLISKISTKSSAFQMVEHLPSKCEALSSNLLPPKNKKVGVVAHTYDYSHAGGIKRITIQATWTLPKNTRPYLKNNFSNRGQGPV